MKFQAITTFILFYISISRADSHLTTNIPPAAMPVHSDENGGSTDDEWEYDKKIIKSLSEIMKLFEDKWSSKISNEIKEEEPSNPPYLKCPNAWPFHDSWPVTDRPCDLDSECEEGKMCCQLFLKHYCLKGVDSRPKPGECTQLEPSTPLSYSNCRQDEAGCFYDAECGGRKKCCQGLCDYKECMNPIADPEALQAKADEVLRGHAFGGSVIARRRRLLAARRLTTLST